MKRLILFLMFISSLSYGQVYRGHWLLYTHEVIIDSLILRMNPTEGVLEFTTSDPEVTIQVGLEDLTRVYNNSGDTIANGKAVYFSGNYLGLDPTVELTNAKELITSISFIGLATGEILNGEYGFVNQRGKVRDIPTDHLSVQGAVFLDTLDGEITMDKPPAPYQVIVVGGCLNVDSTNGTMLVNPSLALQRQIVVKSTSFTSNGILAGTFYKFGFYESIVTDANLDEGSTSITFGTADIAYAAHPFIVAGGAGTVNAGVVGLTATGTKVTDAGDQTPGHIDTLSTDITTLILDEYAEAEKFVGTITYDLIVMSGVPTVYSLDFNYGYAKYEDFGNRDFYITDLECIWQGGASDATGFNIELLHHSPDNWTYSTDAFVPGNGILVERAVDQASFLRVTNNIDAAWKRDNLNTFIDGSGEEGILIRITTGANGTVQTMDSHLGVAID